MDELKNIIESLLFVSEDPLTVDQIRKVVKTADPKAIREALGSLSTDYDRRGGGFFMAEVAGGYQLRTRPEYNEYIKDLLQPSPPRLSKAALETLAIIAYKQPIIRADLEHIRGVDSGGVLRLLLKRKLIRVLGRKEIPGRPLIYATTKRFLEVFDLKDLRDLPTPKEIEELGSEASDELAAAFDALSLSADGPAQPQEEPGLFDRVPEKEAAEASDETDKAAEAAEDGPSAPPAADPATGAPAEGPGPGEETGPREAPEQGPSPQHTEFTNNYKGTPETPEAEKAGGPGEAGDAPDPEGDL